MLEELAQLVSQYEGLGGATESLITVVLRVDGWLRAEVRQLANLNSELRTRVFELEVQMRNTRVRAPWRKPRSHAQAGSRGIAALQVITTTKIERDLDATQTALNDATRELQEIQKDRDKEKTALKDVTSELTKIRKERDQEKQLLHAHDLFALFRGHFLYGANDKDLWGAIAQKIEMSRRKKTTNNQNEVLEAVKQLRRENKLDEHMPVAIFKEINNCRVRIAHPCANSGHKLVDEFDVSTYDTFSQPWRDALAYMHERLKALPEFTK